MAGIKAGLCSLPPDHLSPFPPGTPSRIVELSLSFFFLSATSCQPPSHSGRREATSSPAPIAANYRAYERTFKGETVQVILSVR